MPDTRTQSRVFQYLDAQAIADAPLRATPYDYAHVPAAIPSHFLDEVLSDAPRIPNHGSYAMPRLARGARFDALVQDLLGEPFRDLVARKFCIDLSHCPPCLLMVGNTTGAETEGDAHAASKHKIITVIVGLTRAWPHERGRFRVLNSPDREDCAFEFSPEFGGMLMYRIGDKSWHGYLPQKGPRMSLQLSYVDSENYVRREYFRHGLSAFVKSVPVLGPLVNRLPRNPWGRK